MCLILFFYIGNLWCHPRCCTDWVLCIFVEFDDENNHLSLFSFIEFKQKQIQELLFQSINHLFVCLWIQCSIRAESQICIIFVRIWIYFATIKNFETLAITMYEMNNPMNNDSSELKWETNVSSIKQLFHKNKQIHSLNEMALFCFWKLCLFGFE